MNDNDLTIFELTEENIESMIYEIREQRASSKDAGNKVTTIMSIEKKSYITLCLMKCWLLYKYNYSLLKIKSKE